MKNQASNDHISHRTQFGTFGGVFTPCALTILGVIMFLRFGQIVGQAGILQVMVWRTKNIIQRTGGHLIWH